MLRDLLYGIVFGLGLAVLICPIVNYTLVEVPGPLATALLGAQFVAALIAILFDWATQ